MRYTDFKLTEASNLSTGELVKKIGTVDDRVPRFLDKVKNSSPFRLIAGGEVTVDPEEYDRLKSFLVQGAKGSLKVKTIDGDLISTSVFAKTGEFGGTGESKTGERKIANRGNTIEGVLAAATVARLAARPGRSINAVDVKKIIDQFKNTVKIDSTLKSLGSSITFKAEEVDFTDSFTCKVKLPTKNFIDFVDWDFMMSDSLMAGFITNVIAYVNDAGIVNRFADFFERNKRSDEVEVNADGVSDMSGRKTDIFMVYFDENGKRQIQKFDLSLKAGTTSQFGQASAGVMSKDSEKYAFSQYGFDQYKQIFGDFGVDISPVQEQFLNAEDLRAGVELIYRQAVDAFEDQLQGSDNDQEKKWLKTFVNNIKKHGTLNDPAVQLLQFEKNKYYVLDFQKLDKLFAQDKLDIEVKGTISKPRDGGPGWPSVIFYNKENPKEELIRIRAKYGDGRMNNLIEKGAFFKKLTKVRGN